MAAFFCLLNTYRINVIIVKMRIPLIDWSPLCNDWIRRVITTIRRVIVSISQLIVEILFALMRLELP